MRIGRAVLAGLLGTVVMTVVGLWVLPLFRLPVMSPAGLLAAAFGGNSLPVWVGHFMIGTILAVIYAAVAPLIPGRPVVAGLLYGTAPFLLARIVVVPMIKGQPLFAGGPAAAAAMLVILAVALVRPV